MNVAARARVATLDRLLAGLAANAPALRVQGLTLDSRRVQPGDAFLALRGSRAHGLAHLPQALENGAAAILWEPGDVAAPQAEVPCIAVDKLSARAGEIAARFHGRPADRMFIAGVTGTDGKTSTAHLIAQAFEHLGRRCAYVGTLGLGRLDALDTATHTTPDALRLHAHLAAFAEAGVDACAMEVSSHALDQHRVGGVSFDAVVLTNISRDHLDYHGSVEAYASAKRRLFEPEDARCLILNRDDAQGARWTGEFAERDALCVYGLDGPPARSAQYAIGRELHLHPRGLRLKLDTHRGAAQIDSALLGRFNAYNLLAAVAVLLAAGVELSDAAQVLSSCRTVPGRIEVFHGPQFAAPVVVDYAHTPKALEQVLSALRAHCTGRLICVFGCGGDRDRGKRPLMGEVAARLADEVFLTDDNPRSEAPQDIVAEIVSGMPAAPRVIHARGEAIRAAVQAARAQDLVLVAGKGHETTQTYGAQALEFSDRAFVAQLLVSAH